MAKRRRQAAADEGDGPAVEQHQEPPETPVVTKKRKKAKLVVAERDEDACETPVVTKRRKKTRPAAMEVDEDASMSKKKPQKACAVARHDPASDDEEDARATTPVQVPVDEPEDENEEIEIVPQAAIPNELGVVHTGSTPGDKNTPSSGGEKVGSAGKSFAVFVGGIPWSVTKEGLQKDFEECGRVVKTELFTDKAGVSKGCALITFADAEGLRKALEFDGEDYGGRPLKVSAAESRHHPKGDGKGAKGGSKGKGKGASEKLEVFIKNISSHTQESEFKGHFASCGSIVELSLPTRATGKSKGFGWITFSTQDAFDKALSLNGSELKKFKLIVEQAGQHLSSRGGKGGGKGKGKLSSEFEVFVSNLSYESNEAGVRKYFTDCGEIARMHMPTKVEGKCMGFAWITFKSKEALRSAVDRAGEEFEGRRLKVEKSGQHREEKESAAN